METKQRVLYLDILRIVAIFLMMVLHIASGYLNSVPVGSVNWHIANVYESLVRCCVPVFLMISGRFFLDPKREYTFGKIITKNIKKLVIAFGIWSFAYAVYACLADSNHSMVHILKTFIQQLLTGHYHMWFLFSLVGIYLCVPFLRKITADTKLTGQMLLVTAIFIFVLPFLESVLPFVDSILKIINRDIGFGLLGAHAFYFVLGYYISVVCVTQKWYAISFLGGIVSAIYIIIGTYCLSTQAQSSIQSLYQYETLPVLLESIAVFLLFRKLFEQKVCSETSGKIIKRLSLASFGMYLVHDFFNALFIQIGGLGWTFSYAILIPVVSIGIFFVSFLSIEILQRIPVLGKYIMG